MPIRRAHFWYDLRELLSQARLWLILLIVTTSLILLVNFSCLYPTVFLFITLFLLRTLIGRRCPVCDSRLQAVHAQRDPDNVFILHIIWQCPRDGYQEREATKGDAGLFGAS